MFFFFLIVFGVCSSLIMYALNVPLGDGGGGVGRLGYVGGKKGKKEVFGMMFIFTFCFCIITFCSSIKI